MPKSLFRFIYIIGTRVVDGTIQTFTYLPLTFKQLSHHDTKGCICRISLSQISLTRIGSLLHVRVRFNVLASQTFLQGSKAIKITEGTIASLWNVVTDLPAVAPYPDPVQ